MTLNWKTISAGAGIVVLIVIFTIFFFFRSSPSSSTTSQSGSFGVGENRQVTVTPPTSGGTNEPGNGVAITQATTKIFEINSGPVAGATLIQEGQPTTTVARFVMQDTGHVFDLPLDSPGAVARAVSNTTIPGIASAAWSERGQGVVLQYLENTTTKTLHLAFPPATTTLTTEAPINIKFLPDGIASLAVSPDGKSVAYLVPTSGGSNGYTSLPDGTGSKELFSLPLSQVLISWPSTGTMLAQSTSAAGVPGVLFSIDAKSGTAQPILYADGLTAIADAAFSKVIYQTTETGSRSTYAHDVANGTNAPLSFNPFPEQCIWSNTASSTLYCAAPLTYVAPDFLDLWHMGAASAADSIFAFNITSGSANITATPGGQDGGEEADIASMSISPDDHYLIFIKRGDDSLWGVRLTQ